MTCMSSFSVHYWDRQIIKLLKVVSRFLLIILFYPSSQRFNSRSFIIMFMTFYFSHWDLSLTIVTNYTRGYFLNTSSFLWWLMSRAWSRVLLIRMMLARSLSKVWNTNITKGTASVSHLSRLSHLEMLFLFEQTIPISNVRTETYLSL